MSSIPFRKTGVGVSDNDELIAFDGTGDDVSGFNTWHFQCVAGAADVSVTLDGTNWTGPISLADLGAITSDPVIVMAAGRLYGITNLYVMGIRILQNGATAATVVMMASTNS